MTGSVGIGTADSHVVRYRADVDGLRAIAVLSVIAFHLFHSAVPGGYLGVDIFFVISGYLITLVIWREIQAGQFSIGRFYNRRVRRILPALLFALFVTTLAGTALLLPATLVSFAKSLIATLVFVGNVFFWRDAEDYFSRAAEFKPLLHMWSLGVEEQFYIAFPLILALLARRWSRGALATIALLSIVSVALNVSALVVGQGTFAFYMLPTRAWELGLGAVVALLPPPTTLPARVVEAVSWVGALLVSSSIMYPPEYLAGVPTGLPAVTGVAMLIFAGQVGGSTVHRVLRLRPLVFVGLISYSLYLWHWPIIVLAKNYLVRELAPLEVAAALALMFACATVSWRFVERPFRSRNMPIRTVLGTAGLGVAVLVATATALIWSGGLPGRFEPQAEVVAEAVASNYRCPATSLLAVGDSVGCIVTLPSRNPADADFVLLGDSHVKMYAPVWKTILAERGQTGLIIWSGGCLPTVRANLSQRCLDEARSNLAEVVRLTRARTVVVAFRWSSAAQGLVDASGRSIDDGQERALSAAVDDLVDRLRRAGKRVVLVGPIAEPGYEVASVVSRQLAFHRPMNTPTYLPAEDFARRFEQAVQHFEARGDMGFARADRIQCVSDRCSYLLEGRSLFADDQHIAVAETYRFRQVFESALRAAQSD